MRSEDWKNTLDAMERELVADGLFFPGDVPPPPGVLRQPTRQEAEVGAVTVTTGSTVHGSQPSRLSRFLTTGRAGSTTTAA